MLGSSEKCPDDSPVLDYEFSSAGLGAFAVSKNSLEKYGEVRDYEARLLEKDPTDQKEAYVKRVYWGGFGWDIYFILAGISQWQGIEVVQCGPASEQGAGS